MSPIFSLCLPLHLDCDSPSIPTFQLGIRPNSSPSQFCPLATLSSSPHTLLPGPSTSCTFSERPGHSTRVGTLILSFSSHSPSSQPFHNLNVFISLYYLLVSSVCHYVVSYTRVGRELGLLATLHLAQVSHREQVIRKYGAKQ